MRIAFPLVAFFALSAHFTWADDWAKAYTISSKPELRVETDDGAVTVRTWDDKRISAHVTTTGWRIEPGEVDVHESQTGDRVELTVRLPHVRYTNFMGRRKIQVEVDVPRQTHAEIHTGDGSIHVTGLQGETRLRTGDGSIQGDSLDGTLYAHTGDGHLHIRGRFDILDLHTGDGSIEADVLPGSKMGSSWRVETGDGSVTLRLPNDFGAELDVHTGDGRISMNYPVTVHGYTQFDRHHVNGRVNGGGAPLTVRTQDGSVHIASL